MASKSIINVHVGQFGINLAKCLYGDSATSMDKRNAVLADCDNDSLDEFACSHKGFEHMVYNNSNDYGNGEYFHSQFTIRLLDQITDEVRKVAEPMDSVQGLVYYSSLGGSLGSYGLDRIRMTVGKVPIVAAQVYPDVESPDHSLAGPMETYNFVNNLFDTLSHASLCLMFTNR